MTSPRFHPLTRLLYCGLGIIAAVILFSLLPLIGHAALTMWRGHPPNEGITEIAQNYALPLTVAFYFPAVAWIYYCRTKFDRHSFVSLGLRARRAWPDMLRGAATGALCISLLWSILWLSGGLQVAGLSKEALDGGANQTALSLVGYLLVFAAVAFFEELSFRGYMLQNMTEWLGWKGAVAAQAIIFGLVHMPVAAGGSLEDIFAAVGALPSLMLIAVFFALCYRKTGSLWFPIGFHFAWNFCLGPVLSLAVSGNPTFHLLQVDLSGPLWLTGGSFGPEGSFLLIPILGVLVFFINRAPDHPQALLDLALSAREGDFAPGSAPTPVDETEEGQRENRFRTKFGSSEGFSAETLRELRDLQEERERVRQEAAAAAKREQAALSGTWVNPDVTPLSLEVAPENVPMAQSVSLEETAVTAAAPAPVQLPATVPQPEPAPPRPLEPERTQPTPVVSPVAPTPVVNQPPAAPVPATQPAPKAPAPSTDVPVKKKPPAPRW